MTELKKLISECEFDNIQDSLNKDMIVLGARDDPLREKLLRECDLYPKQLVQAMLLSKQ